MYGNGINAYRQVKVTTADPKKLILMCYEGVISNLKIAKDAYTAGEFEAKGKAVQKVQDILTLLIQSLDFDQGGSIAMGLNSLYTYMMRRLTEADVQRELKIFDEIIGMLEELESAWKEISDTPISNNISDSRHIGFTEEKKQEVSKAIGGAY
ncbi:MAG: flagellar export chaperone FliS [Deltaproteobacteria bacterium]|nr:flagellar export chaperone FliS [Deltaproteobacteria bacterium]